MLNNQKAFKVIVLKENLISNESKSREYIYYRYWQHDIKRPAHLGIRSKDYKINLQLRRGLGKSGTNKQKN